MGSLPLNLATTLSPLLITSLPNLACGVVDLDLAAGFAVVLVVVVVVGAAALVSAGIVLLLSG